MRPENTALDEIGRPKDQIAVKRCGRPASLRSSCPGCSLQNPTLQVIHQHFLQLRETSSHALPRAGAEHRAQVHLYQYAIVHVLISHRMSSDVAFSLRLSPRSLSARC